MHAWRLRATFNNGSVYTSPDVRRSDPGWGGERFIRPIRRLEFFLPTGHCVRLQGFEAYNFFVEASQALGGGPARIEAFFLCGRAGGRVVTYRVSEGRVEKQTHPDGQEWGGQPSSGWKPGVPGGRRSGVVAW